MFGNLLKEAGEPADRTLSDQVMTYWTNFAKTGNPNGGSLPNWVRHDPMTAAYIDFASGGPLMRERASGSTPAGSSSRTCLFRNDDAGALLRELLARRRLPLPP